MSKSVLVAWSSRYGSTREVAERVAETLRGRGIGAEVRPARELRSLEGFDMVVVGTALYIGHWLKDTDRFLEKHREALSGLKFALFALGPTELREEDLRGARAMFDAEMGKIEHLKPVSAEMFGGKYDPARLRFPHSLLAKLPASPLYGAPARDARDWDAIKAWTGMLADTLE